MNTTIGTGPGNGAQKPDGSAAIVSAHTGQFPRRPENIAVTAPLLPSISPALSALRDANIIVAVGSVDGVLTAAAALRHNADAANAKLIFTQAFLVDKLNPAEWSPAGKVLFVDLAVNNKAPDMTVAFLRKVQAAGHTIVGICDEHDGAAWNKALSDAGLERASLGIAPVSGKGTATNSSGALLKSLLGTDADEHTQRLCDGAENGDRMKFEGLAGVVNEAVKSNITDDQRRKYLAHFLAQDLSPDEKITGWIAEYKKILENNKEVIATGEVVGGKMFKVTPGDKVIDVTALMSELYKKHSVVIVDGLAFNPSTKQKERLISFGCAPSSTIDLLAALKAAGISASGIPQKVSVSPADEGRATKTIGELLTR